MKNLIYLVLFLSNSLVAQQSTLLLDIDPGPANGVYDYISATIGNQYFFYGNTPAEGLELWVTDGTTAGTHLVKDIIPGPASGVDILPLTVFKNKVWFSGTDSGLWSSDGTAAGTVGLYVNAAGDSISGPGPLIAGTNYMYFTSYRQVAGVAERSLWRTDGTKNGTNRIVTDAGGYPFSVLHDMVVLHDTAYFTFGLNSGGSGQLWRSDGSAAGTVLVKKIPIVNFGAISLMRAIGDRIYFAGKDWISPFNYQPWVSDGTKNGTIQLATLDAHDNAPSPFYSFEGKAYFSTLDSSLWRTDGTPAGTEKLIGPIVPTNFLDSANFLAINEYLYFAGTQNGYGRELWRTDSAGNYTMLQDLNPGAASSNPKAFALGNGKIYFQAEVAGHGKELAVSDGTSDGTYLLPDLVPGPGGAAPHYIAQIGTHLVFIATHPDYGRELFTFDLTTPTHSAYRPEMELQIAPNPVTDQFRLTLPANSDWRHAHLQIYDASGKLIAERLLTGIISQIDLSGIVRGVYWLEYTDSTGHLGRKKLIKQ